MSYRLNDITCRNFKFFYGKEESERTNKIVLNGKHLLLYGENGSGKSSLYWALYTMLQSSIKFEDNDVLKYFKVDNPENIRNRFCSDDDISGINVSFGDTTDAIHSNKLYEISDEKCESLHDSFMKKTLLSSDFINYKYLSKLYDFRNSEEIDLFPIFEHDLFPFIHFEQGFIDIQGFVDAGKTYASDWWKGILSIYDFFRSSASKVKTKDNRYINFQHTLTKFNELFLQYLNSITEKTNRYLRNNFYSPFEIRFVTDRIQCEYDKRVPGTSRKRDGKLHKPHLGIKIIYNNELLDEQKQSILKPHTFLNEAKLTLIALSIRLAMLEDRAFITEDGAKIIVLDDLLISLDMSNRDMILDTILKLSDDFQLIIMTHDRAFYNIIHNRLNKSNKLNGWVCKEMYESYYKSDDIIPYDEYLEHEDNEISYDEYIKKNAIPRPQIINTESYLDRSMYYISESDYPTAANYLRKSGEEIISNLLPHKLAMSENHNQEMRPLMLANLITNFKKICDISMPKCGSLCDKLDGYRDRIMNPLSHNNLKSPIYKQEVLNCYHILEKINKFEKVSSLNKNDSLYMNLVGYDGELWKYEINLLGDNFWIIKADDEIYIHDVMCTFKYYKDSDKKEYTCNVKFKHGLNMIKHELKLAHEIDVLNQIYINEDIFLNSLLKN